ncbi:MAG: Lrp/AsnC family transcriptional regulator [Flavobacteriaceae bacterium]|nr:Lrp/AsnC family transcriptional regulator [Flavobacteriaceae bacterium]
MRFDEIDKKILFFLQKDSKITTKELSIYLNLSSTAVYERIKKLEKKGVIEKYVALINKEKVEKAFVVFCQIKLIQHKHAYVKKFEKEVIKFEEVLECYNVSGDYDYFLKIVVKNMEEYHNFLNDKLTTLDHISSAHSTFIMNEVKNNFTIKL